MPGLLTEETTRRRGINMDEFSVLMDFVRDTREQQQKYLDAIRTDSEATKTENRVLIERYRAESIALIKEVETRLERTIDRLQDQITSLKNWHATTLTAVMMTGLGIIASIWLK